MAEHEHSTHATPDGHGPIEPVGWADDPKKVAWAKWGTVALFGATLAVDLLSFPGGPYHKHGHYAFEEVPLLPFHGVYGFVSCVLLVLAAVELRKIVMRSEDYYDA